MPTSQLRLPPLTAAQIRAARALLRWRAEDLAEHSALGLATIRRAEGAEGKTPLTAANDRAVRRALEDAGVVFVDAVRNGGGLGEGARLRESSAE
jgi:hypothetical protein